MERTLVHEDIYVYIDPIIEVSETKTAANSFAFTNDATEQVADLGVFEIEVVSGSYSKVVITAGNKNTTINAALAAGEKLVLDFRNLHFSKGGSLYFAEDSVGSLTDNSNSNVTVSLTGAGSAKVTRRYYKAQVDNDDIWFVEGISADTKRERIKKTFLSGKEKTLKSEKKVHSFSINGLWSQEEISKFTDMFRMRLVDGDGNKLDTLANCLVESESYSSSSGGDLTYTISGSCEKIF